MIYLYNTYKKINEIFTTYKNFNTSFVSLPKKGEEDRQLLS